MAASELALRFVADCMLEFRGEPNRLRDYVDAEAMAAIRRAAASLAADGGTLVGEFTNMSAVRVTSGEGDRTVAVVEFDDETRREFPDGRTTGVARRVRWAVTIDAAGARVLAFDIQVAGPGGSTGAAVPRWPRPNDPEAGMEASAGEQA